MTEAPPPYPGVDPNMAYPPQANEYPPQTNGYPQQTNGYPQQPHGQFSGPGMYRNFFTFTCIILNAVVHVQTFFMSSITGVGNSSLLVCPRLTIFLAGLAYFSKNIYSHIVNILKNCI